MSQYTLTIAGHVDNPLTLTLDDLKAMPQRTYQAFLECSGNGRGFFLPAVKGGQWRNDAIGNAEWTGVPLHEVLVKAGVKDGAVDVVSQGGDFPEMQRGLPIDVAMGADTILTLQMNGEDLPAPHGGPVRQMPVSSAMRYASGPASASLSRSRGNPRCERSVVRAGEKTSSRDPTMGSASRQRRAISCDLELHPYRLHRRRSK